MNSNVLPFDDHSTIKAQAREWLIRLDRDESPSQEDLHHLHQWAAQSPAHQAELERISAFWQDANVLNELSTPVYDRAPHPLWLLACKLWGQHPIASIGALATSACVALLMVFTILPVSNTATNGLYTTQIGQVQEHQLADGSTLQLNTNSQVAVTYNDSQRKITLLSGEAHFEVAPNKQWPFEVYAGKGRVKALGTAFSVRFDSHNINVIVSHGEVELAAQLEPAPEQNPTQTLAQIEPVARLTIGQSTRIKNAAITKADSNDQQPATNIIEYSPEQLAQELSWRTGYLLFAGEPLPELIKKISRYTSVNIQITDPTLNQVRVGGRFKVGELDAMLEVLETSFGIQVSHIDDHHIQLQAKK